MSDFATNLIEAVEAKMGARFDDPERGPDVMVALAGAVAKHAQDHPRKDDRRDDFADGALSLAGSRDPDPWAVLLALALGAGEKDIGGGYTLK